MELTADECAAIDAELDESSDSGLKEDGGPPPRPWFEWPYSFRSGFWKVPFRGVHCDSFKSFVQEIIWCHLVRKIWRHAQQNVDVRLPFAYVDYSKPYTSALDDEVEWEAFDYMQRRLNEHRAMWKYNKRSKERWEAKQVAKAAAAG